MTRSDDLYRKKFSTVPPFTFDQDTAGVFDDMAGRSIPFYHELQIFVAAVAARYYQGGTRIYDLGCATGTTVLAIDQALDRPYTLVAVDKSSHMIRLAQQKCRHLTSVRWLTQGIEDTLLDQASVINAAYVLQFVEPSARPALLQRMAAALEPKGVLILSEKSCSDHQELNALMTDHYYRFKAGHGYSPLEIEQKEQALKSVLTPSTVTQWEKMLQAAGFKAWHSVFKFMNFTTWVVFK